MTDVNQHDIGISGEAFHYFLDNNPDIDEKETVFVRTFANRLGENRKNPLAFVMELELFVDDCMRGTDTRTNEGLPHPIARKDQSVYLQYGTTVLDILSVQDEAAYAGVRAAYEQITSAA